LSDKKTNVWDEFGSLAAVEWMDATVLTMMPNGLRAEVQHPRTNQSVVTFLRHGQFKPSPQLKEGTQLRVRVVNVRNRKVDVTTLPESFVTDFAGLSPDLWLNGTVTNVEDFGIFVLVEPPVGSSGGPHPGLVMRAAEATEFSAGDEVRVRVTRTTSDGKLYLSMRDGGSLSDKKTNVWDEFGSLAAVEWMDATVLTMMPNGLRAEVQHPRTNQSVVTFLRHGQFKPSPQLKEGTQLRVRVVNVRNRKVDVTTLPESFVTDFAGLSPDLWLNGTVTNVEDFGIFVLVEPPVGSSGGPHPGLAAAEEATEKDPKRKFSAGDEVRVRVTRTSSDGKLYLSMRDRGNLSDLQRILGTDMLEATVTNVSDRGLKVSIQLEGSDTVYEGSVPPSAASWSKFGPGVHAVGNKVKARLVNLTPAGRPVFSLLDKQDVSAWVDASRSQWLQGVIANVSSQGILVRLRRSEEDQPVLGILDRMWEDEHGSNDTAATVGHSVWVRLRAVYGKVGKIVLTASRIRHCKWFQVLPAGTWLDGQVRRPCAEGWIVRVTQPTEAGDGMPGFSCRGVLPQSETEGVIDSGTRVRVRLTSTNGTDAQFTMKQ